jgi:CheY-like chemotaxis protein/HPt (histidine-containing phosphotransfer) domain-containing protein
MAPLSVLVVEDNTVNQRVLSLQLERASHRVKVVENGQEALDVLAREPFDLVLMDLQMPQMDGVRTARLIRAREKAFGGHVAIIAVTANHLPGERQRCLSAGMDDYLVKPIRAAELYAAIARVTGRAAPDSAPAGTTDAKGWLDALAAAGFSPSAITRLAQAFVAEVPGRMDRLRQAVQAGDAEGVHRAGHALKGTLTVFHASAATEAAAALEDMGRRQELGEIAQPLATLEGEVQTLLAELNAYVQGASG